MRVSTLYDTRKGQDAYIVGSGPSLRYYDLRFLEGRWTIGLNRAHYLFPVEHTITAHPELAVEYEKLPKLNRNSTKWIIKAFKPPLRLTLEDKRYYVFRGGSPSDGHQLRFFLERSPEEYLYQGRGIHQTAINLAVHMGARAIFMVGCDMCSLTDEHHGHEQPTKFLGLQPDRVYREYRDFTDHVRALLRDELGIPLITLSPFIGLNSVEEDANRLREQLHLKSLPMPKDVSKYVRDKADLPA